MTAAAGDRILIENPIDLEDTTINLAPDMELIFRGKGYLANGTITGNNTKITASELNGIFMTGLTFNGTWIVDEVPVCWFGGLDAAKNNLYTSLTAALNFAVKCFPGVNVVGGHTRGGIKITIPNGTFSCQTTIPLVNFMCDIGRSISGTTGIIIQGAGKYQTIINNSASIFIENGVDGTGTGRGSWGFTIKDMTITGGKALRFVMPYDVYVENVRFMNGTVGIQTYLTVNTHVRGCTFYNMSSQAILMQKMGSGPSTTMFIDDCWITHCGTGLHIAENTNYGYDVHCRNVIFEYNTRAFYLENNAYSQVYFNDCFFEGNSSGSMIGASSTYSDNSVFFKNCINDSTDSGFTFYGGRCIWDCSTRPNFTKSIQNNGLTIRVNGVLEYEQIEGHYYVSQTWAKFNRGDSRLDIIEKAGPINTICTASNKIVRAVFRGPNGYYEGIFSTDSSGVWTINSTITSIGITVAQNSSAFVSQNGGTVIEVTELSHS